MPLSWRKIVGLPGLTPPATSRCQSRLTIDLPVAWRNLRKLNVPKQQYDQSVESGIAHLMGHTKGNGGNAIEFLNNGRGSRSGCLCLLASYAQAKSLLAWFSERDLPANKHWAYVAAKLNRMYFQLSPAAWFPAYEHLYALLCDDPESVNWYRQHTVSYFIAGEIDDRDNPKQAAFHGYQALLALNGEWELLAQRCEQILATDIKKDRRFLIDHRFYLALARGDRSGMESVLNELTSPKVAARRNVEQAFGLTERLIATHATIYAKIAWRHGYEVEVDSPWVPSEWLPIQPLDRYEDPWDFMNSFDLYQPFENGWGDWSPVPGDRKLIR